MARLNGNRGDGWCAKEGTRNDDWLQVDFRKTVQVCTVATQGDINGNEWTTVFKLSYSSDGNTWTTYKYANGTKEVRLRSKHPQDKTLFYKCKGVLAGNISLI